MPVITDGIGIYEVNRRDNRVFDAEGGSTRTEFTYNMAQWGADYIEITALTYKDLNLSLGKKYRISIEEVDGR